MVEARPQIEGVVVVMHRRGRYLFIQRGPAGSLPGRWCPVSGRIEPGETEPETVVRESLEEVGAEVRPVRKLMEGPSEHGRVWLHYWLAEWVSGEPRRAAPDEVSDLAWVDLAGARALPGNFAPDIALLERLAAE